MFFNFFILHSGLKYRDIDRIRSKIKELNARLKKYIGARKKCMSEWKSKNLITPLDTKQYGDSQFVKDVVKNLSGENQKVLFPYIVFFLPCLFRLIYVNLAWCISLNLICETIPTIYYWEILVCQHFYYVIFLT